MLLQVDWSMAAIRERHATVPYSVDQRSWWQRWVRERVDWLWPEILAGIVLGSVEV